MTIKCFYHSADLDGHCSGAIVKFRFPEAVMHPINYGDPFPWKEIKEDDEVYMVDFCLQPFEDMVRLYDLGANVVWIDHHKSAIDSYNKWYHNPKTDALDYMKFEGERNTIKAACELTWEYLFPDQPVPLAVKLLSLYDSWTYQGHELEDMVLPFQMRMRMEDLDPKDWSGLIEKGGNGPRWHNLFMQTDLDYWIKEGRLLLRYDEVQKAKYASTYAFETRLNLRSDPIPGRLTPLDISLSAIAVNLGHTNSKVFDSVWRRDVACSYCKVAGRLNQRLDIYGPASFGDECRACNGTGKVEEEPYDLMITFVRRKDELWNVSLYSTKEHVDCGVIAKSFGGGGHKGAAGFQCKDLPFDY